MSNYKLRNQLIYLKLILIISIYSKVFKSFEFDLLKRRTDNGHYEFEKRKSLIHLHNKPKKKVSTSTYEVVRTTQ